MVKSIDICRGRQAVEQDRIRRVVRQHQAQRKNEALPGAGIFGFLAGWSLMSALNNIFKDRK